MWGRDLPEDVSMEILSRLPVKSLMRFKCISKSWFALITSPNFITKHLTSHNPHTGTIFGSSSWVNGRRLCWLSNETLEMSGDEVHFSQLFQDEEQVQVVDIFGPCNGILCLAGTLTMENGGLQPDYEIVLWNPATRESKMLPPMDVATSTFKANFGFGYDPKTNDYKVVTILSSDSHCQVVVYSLSTNSWRVIDSTLNPSYSIVLPRYPSYLNGVHHWCARATGKLPFLLSFDMSNEVFHEVPGPLTKGSFSEKVAVINDSVALILRFSQSEDWSEIWVLNESAVERTWTKISTIPYPWDLNMIQLREDCSLVLRNDDGFFDLYDPRTQEWKPLKLNEALDAQIVSYTESLVFLNGSRGNKTIHNKFPHHFGDRASDSFSNQMNLTMRRATWIILFTIGLFLLGGSNLFSAIFRQGS